MWGVITQSQETGTPTAWYGTGAEPEAKAGKSPSPAGNVPAVGLNEADNGPSE